MRATGICGALGECAHLLHRAGLDDAVAGEDDGALGVADELGGLREACVIDAQHGVGAIGARLGGGKVEDGRGLLRVLGDVDEHRAGAAGLGDLEGVADCGRNVFGAADEEVVLGHGQRDAGDVDFLKRVGAENFAGDVAGDADDGNGIEHGGGDAGDEVCRAGAAGGDGDADLARGARIAVGHVRSALLVANEDVVNGKLAQRVVDGQNRAAGVAEDVGNALAYQRGPHDFCAGEAGGGGEVGVGCLRGCVVSHGWLLEDSEQKTEFCCIYVVAPTAALVTRSTYLRKTPAGQRNGGGLKPFRRAAISSSLTSRVSLRLGMSKWMMSPSRTAAMGPPTKASGATWPAVKPRVAPEKRPSVSSATWALSSALEETAAVTCSISRMPGPPLGPS